MRPYLKQLKSLLLHKWYFFRAGRYLGLPLWLCLAHDLSKFAPVEFINYSRWFYDIRSIEGWAKAWRHHAHHNKHHPEHWVLAWRGDPDFYSGMGKRLADFVTVLAMPDLYVREMIADFMASSKQHTGSYDIAVWLNEHGPTMLLHPDTETWLHHVMETDRGWFCTDNCPFSFMASDSFREWDR